MGVYDTFKAAPNEKLTQGVWVPYGEFRVKIRYAGKENKKYAKCLRTLTAPYERVLNNPDLNIDDATQKILDDVFAEIYARSILVDWEDFTDATGELLPFSEENAKQVLIDLPLFFDEIKTVAGTMQAFREQKLEDESKNS
jgi:hypothetical protein